MELCIICTDTTYTYVTPCGHTLCLSCIKSVRNRQSYCPFCNTVLPNDFCNAPEKTKTIGTDTLVVNLPDTVWLYEGRNLGWWAFNYDHQRELEAHYKNSDTTHTCSLLICGNNIIIHFDKMIQSNGDSIREIKRVQKTDLCKYLFKGVAGMK